MPTIKRFSKADQDLLAATFEQIRSRHASTVENLADIVIGLRKIEDVYTCSNVTEDVDVSPDYSIIDKDLIDKFLKDRLGIQLLCDHYVALSKQIKKDSDCLSGGIRIDCNFIDVLNDAILEAKHVCDANLGIAPEVYVFLPNVDDQHEEGLNIQSGIIDDESISITLIRPWIHHVLVEVLKNAMSSNVERFLETNISSSVTTKVHLPPSVYVKVLITDDFLVCEVIDQGVGINNTDTIVNCEDAFTFAFSSSGQRWDRLDEQQSYAMVRSPLGSLGVGLTLSRFMMRMFGGDLMLCNRPHELKMFHEEGDDMNGVNIASGCTATVQICKDPTIMEWH